MVFTFSWCLAGTVCLKMSLNGLVSSQNLREDTRVHELAYYISTPILRQICEYVTSNSDKLWHAALATSMYLKPRKIRWGRWIHRKISGIQAAFWRSY